MTTVYSKNGICFLIPPASNYRCNGEVWCYCNNSEYNLGFISEPRPCLRNHPSPPSCFQTAEKGKFLSPHRDSIIYRVFWK